MAMFNATKSTQSSETPSVNLIGLGTTITGDVQSSGDIRIDGTLVGNLHTKGKIIIGNSGKIEGDINCVNADLFGTIKGNIKVSELLTLKASANLIGDIATNKLSIEPGANFTGACSMGAVVKDIKNVDKSNALKAEKIA